MSSDAPQPELDLGAHLVARGADPGAVQRARAEGPEAMRRLGYGVLLLGEVPSLRPPQIWNQVGADEQFARDLWRAMGFAHIPDDVHGLTSADADALSAINNFLAATGRGPETAVRFARMLGQAMGRVAEALVTMVDESVDELALQDGDDEDLAVVAADLALPLLEHEIVYLLRRHLYAVAMRRLVDEDERQDDSVVGFADVVQFTRLSGQLPEAELAELLEIFESETADAIADHGGRVVKLIGDAVLFEMDDDADAACLALDLVEQFGGDRPELRVGLAHGPTLARQGDLFGPVVNLASRLVGLARPGSVLIDEPLASHLKGDDRFVLKSLRTRELKGLGETKVYVLRRADAPR